MTSVMAGLITFSVELALAYGCVLVWWLDSRRFLAFRRDYRRAQRYRTVAPWVKR